MNYYYSASKQHNTHENVQLDHFVRIFVPSVTNMPTNGNYCKCRVTVFMGKEVKNYEGGQQQQQQP